MWKWLQKAKHWVNQTLKKVLGRSDIDKIIERNQQVYLTSVDSLASRLMAGELSVADWELEMRALIKRQYLQMYMLGKGGRERMTRKDYSSIGGMLGRDQFKYLDRFAGQIENGELTPGQIMARSRMYIKSSREAYNRALGRAYGIPEGILPAYPGDGNSCEGLTNCGCQWEIKETFDGWDAYWRLGETEHCKKCIKHSEEWAPYHIVRPDYG